MGTAQTRYGHGMLCVDRSLTGTLSCNAASLSVSGSPCRANIVRLQILIRHVLGYCTGWRKSHFTLDI